jgi:hypothetical protein
MYRKGSEIMKTKKHWILPVVLAIALVAILIMSEVYAIDKQNEGLLNDVDVSPSHTSIRSVAPWSKEELKVLNKLINKNATHGWSSSSRSLPGEDLNAPLSGLKTVQLLITSPYKKTMRTNVERELQQVGIQVIDFEARHINNKIVLTNKETPIFYVKLNTYKHPYLQLYSYGCKVALIERVSLRRRANVTYLAQTWWTPILVGTVSKEQMPGAIQSCVGGRLMEFIDAYLAANPQISRPPDTTDITVKPEKVTKPDVKPAVAEQKYIASKNSRVFHKSYCHSLKRISAKNLVSYSSKDEATEACKRPCKTCEP